MRSEMSLGLGAEIRIWAHSTKMASDLKDFVNDKLTHGLRDKVILDIQYSGSEEGCDVMIVYREGS